MVRNSVVHIYRVDETIAVAAFPTQALVICPVAARMDGIDCYDVAKRWQHCKCAERHKWNESVTSLGDGKHTSNVRISKGQIGSLTCMVAKGCIGCEAYEDAQPVAVVSYEWW